MRSYCLFPALTLTLAVQGGCGVSAIGGADEIDEPADAGEAGDSGDTGDDPGAPGDALIQLLPGEVSALPCYRSPAAEAVDNLLDGDSATKFLAFNNSVFFTYDAGSPYVPSSYAITSANDFPERDPRSWILSASNDAQTWIDIDVRVGEAFAERLQRREFAVQGSSFYRYYRLRMENQASGVTQLADFELFGTVPYAAAQEPPAAASQLVASAVSRHQIDLLWQDTAQDETYYRIESSSDGQNFFPLAYAPANAQSFSVRGLRPGTSYSYRVVAENGAGVSTPSSASGASTLPAPAATVNGDTSTYAEGGFSITLTDANTGTPQLFKDGLVEEFFRSFPAMVAAYNPAAVKDVHVTFDPTYDGIAFANFGTGNITIASNWAKTTDPDGPLVILHEGFHLIQNYDPFDYNTPAVPGWAAEGLADFARWEFDAAYPSGCWTMQRYEAGQNYTDAYGVTARFLLWLRDNVRPTIAKELDATLRSNQYTEAFWTSATAKTVEELWAEYAAVPAHQPVSYP